jgi:putative heme-binding domain-containing protein
MALRDALRPDESWKHLATPRWSQADTERVADVALGVPTAAAAAFLMANLTALAPNTEQVQAITRHVARFGSDEVRNKVLALVRANRSPDLQRAHALFRAFEQGNQERGLPLSDEARSWAVELTGKLLASSKSSDVLAGVGLAGSLRLESAQEKLIEMAASTRTSEKQRVAALTSLVAIEPRKHCPLLGRILADARESLPLREQTIGLLARLNHAEAHAELLAALATAPARLQSTIALGLAAGPAGTEKLLDAVAAGKASARLLRERTIELRLQESKLANLQDRLAKLTSGLPPADERFQDMMNRRRAGFTSFLSDTAQGQKVFEKHCMACHQLANKGAKVGPQLDGIGTRGVDRLLEDLLDPNRNVDQAFRSTTLALKNGQLLSGLLLREEGEVLVMADPQGKEVRVPKDGVDARNVSAISPMPANLIDQISEPDFYHLLAYLLVQRPVDPPRR